MYKQQRINRKLVADQFSVDRNNFSAMTLNPLLAEYNPQKFKKGEYIFLPKEPANKFYLVIEGIVKLGVYHSSGKSVTKAVLRQGDFFGEYALMGVEEHPYYAMAGKKDVTVSVIPIEALMKMLQENNDLSFFLMNRIGNALLEKEKLVASIIFEDSRTRIIAFLLNLTKKKGIRIGYEKLVRDMMTHQEIADLTATSRQTVTTTIGELRKKNILKTDRKRMLVRSIEKLANALEAIR